jgi:cell division protein FtsI (penicillin-binding protein 3)
VPEIGSPLSPDKWREINTITIAYGHGIAVSPLQLITAVSAIANGGILPKPTLIKVDDADRRPLGPRIISRETSRQVRTLMRDVVVDGTGKMADVVGYDIGGKTGTADKAIAHGYSQHRLLSSFIGVFPIDSPDYAVLAILDEPKGTKKTFGFATGGWVAAPVVKHVVAQMGPIMGLLPSDREAIQVAIEAEQKKHRKLVVAKPAVTRSKPKVTPVAAR